MVSIAQAKYGAPVRALCFFAALAAPASALAADPPATPPAAEVAAEKKEAPKDEKPPPAKKPHEWVRFKLGRGFELRTPDNLFSLSIRTRVQFRYDVDVPHLEDEDPTHTLQIRRMRLQLMGHTFSEHAKYYIQLGFSPRDMIGGLADDLVESGDSKRINPIRDARLEFDYLRDLNVLVGQQKVPFSRQRYITSGALELVDRSLANEEFQLDRDIGLHVQSRDLFGLKKLAYSLGVFMGEGRNMFEARDFAMLWVARAEFLPFGPFDDYSEADLARSHKPGLSFSAAYAFHDDAFATRSVHGAKWKDGGTTDYHHVMADFFAKYRGLSATLAFHFREGTRNPGDAVDDAGNPVPVQAPRNGVGLFAQLGWLMPWANLQLVGRWASVRKVGGDQSSMRSRDELGGGLSYYFQLDGVPSHSYKIQADYFRLWGEAEDPDSFLGALEKGVDRVRLQVQLAL